MDNDNERAERNTENETTKEKILFESIKLFSQKGYKEVSVRDISEAVGIRASSIYNHFDSKKAILDAIYEYYDQQWKAAVPDVNELLRLAETEAADIVLQKMLFDWKPELQEIINRI